MKRPAKPDEGRETRVGRLDDVATDVRFGLRLLRKRPVFATVVALTLALGLGAATAMFTVLDGILLKPLPVEDEDRVVVVWRHDLERDAAHVPLSYAAFAELRRGARLLDGVTAVPWSGPAEWTSLDWRDEPLAVQAAVVTGEFFDVLGLRPALGRLLRPEDDEPGAARTIVLSHDVWRRAFGSDPDVVGRALRLNVDGVPYTVVGVAPAGFEFPRGVDIWTPLVPLYSAEGQGPGGQGPRLFERGGVAFLDVVARLRPGATAEQATLEVDALLAAHDPDAHGPQHRVVARTLPEVLYGDSRPALLTLSAGVGLLLLIAIVNVAGMLLIHGLERRQELALRAALGAVRRRLVRQLATESLLLALAGALLAVLLARWAVDGLLAIAPADLPRTAEVVLDSRAAGFAALLAVAASLVFGLIPALSTTRAHAPDALRAGGRSAGPDRRSRLLRHGLIVAQVALTVMVVAGAGLLVRSLAHLQALDPGFDTEDVVLARLTVPQAKYPDPARYRATLDRIVAEVQTLPGVTAAAPLLTRPFPGTAAVFITMFTGEGQSAEQVAGNPWLNYELATDDLFRTLGLEMLAGRPIERTDRGDAEPVVVIDETLARALWPGESAVGKRLKWGGPDSPSPWLRVVGVVGAARYRDFREPRPTIYVPAEQGIPLKPGYLAIRTAAASGAWVRPLRDAVASVDPDIVVVGITPMARLLDEPLARPRFQTVLLGLLAAVAVALSAVGIYGTVAFYVRRRTRELAIRMALGATAADVRRLVIRQGARLAGAGVLLGLIGSLAAARILESLLFGVRPTDPIALSAAATVLLGIALLAAAGPARRAGRADPAVALRAE